MTPAPLTLFTNPSLLAHIQRNILVRFLEDMKHCLPPEAADILAAGLPHEEFCAGLAAQFRSPSAFGAPLLQALCDIETLALPENSSLLKDALDHLPRGYDVNQNLPSLHQALHLWLIAQNTPGVTFPISSPTLSITLSPTLSQSSDSSPPAAPVPVLPLAEPLIENQKSKIENTSAPHQSLNPSIHQSTPITPSLQDPITPPLQIETPNSKIDHDSPIENPNSKIENPLPASPLLQNSISKIELQQILEHLAKLNPIEYDLARRAEAKRLGIRLVTLDDAVDLARIPLDDAQANQVILPQLEPWPEPILDPPALFDQVHDRFLLYLYLPGGAAVVFTLWVPHAHAINAFTHTPRLNLTSTEPGCGKSTALDLLAAMTPKPLRTDNLKIAVLYRVVDKNQPTLHLDELDSYLHLYPELRGLLNAGIRPGGCAFRCEGHVPRSFKAFAATALAGIGPLAPTLHDRSIVIPLVKAPPGSLQARFDLRHLETETILGRKIARWAQDNFAALAACDPPMPTYNRLADKWRPLFALAQIIGGHWPQRILDAFHTMTNPANPAADPTTLALLADIHTVFTQLNSPCVSSKQLVNALLALPQRPWAAATPGKVIDETWLAARLRPLDIRPHNIHFAGRRAKGYALTDFTQAFAQFLKI